MNSYVKIKIIGKNPLLFFKRIIMHNINYKHFKQINHREIQIIIDYSSYLKLKEKSGIYEIYIIKRYGVNKLENFFIKNLSFIICFFISILMFIVLSNTIFEIDIIHNNSKLRKLVREELNYYNIKKFRLIPSYNRISYIKNEIIKNNKNDIEWLEIERLGSKLIVKITQRKINETKENLAKRHIVAKKSGIIMKIEAEEGVILKKTNDYVSKGEIIISGDVIKDETVKGQVVSKGVVYAETWYKVNVEYPLYYEQITYLDDVKNNLILNFFSKEYLLKKNFAKSYLEKKKNIITSKIFPFSISIEKQRKIKVTKEKLSEKNAILRAQEIAEKKVLAKLSNDEYIISKKTLNFYKNNSRIVVDVFFKVCENITDYMNVDENLLKIPEPEE